MKKIFIQDLEIITHLYTGRFDQLVVIGNHSTLEGPAESYLHYATWKSWEEASSYMLASYTLVLLEPLPGRAWLPDNQLVIDFGNNALPGSRWHYKNNPDGSMRWVQPAACRKPLFLNTYNNYTFRGRIFRKGVEEAARLNQLPLIFSGSFRVTYSDEPYFARNIPDPTQLAIFMGTVGINKKLVISTGEGSFIKYPLGERGAGLLHNEQRMLELLNSLDIDFTHPRPVTPLEQGLWISNVKPERPLTNVFGTPHFQFLGKLYRASARTMNFAGWQGKERIYKNLTSISPRKNPDEKLLFTRLQQRLLTLYYSIPDDAVFYTAIGHNDFTPWNSFLSRNEFAVYDWELARPDLPLLHDFYHFHLQEGVMIKGQDYPGIRLQMQKMLSSDQGSELVHDYEINGNLYFALYLLHTVSYYLGVYSRQEALHPQALAILETWEQAIEDTVVRLNQPNCRKDFITDLFQYLANQSYALLKLNSRSIHEMDQHSDLDLVVEPQNKEQIIEFIRCHLYVDHVTLIPQHHVSLLYVFFKNGDYLEIDLITSLERKSLKLKPTAEVLQSVTADHEGIKRLQDHHTFEYMLLFYLLNRADIPEKHQRFFMQKSEEERMSILIHLVKKYNLVYFRLQDLLKYRKSLHRQLRRNLLLHEDNHRVLRGIRYLHYLGDVGRNLLSRRGMMITFTGVDGAGKTTVLQHVQTILEKKYRRKVVLLRHRPSLLPILSAWRYGKQQAEQRAAHTLPRQGRQQNLLKSLLRFSYYYLDYLLGQWYINLKYLSRNQIVLYDRYYFDFIVDGRRSSIDLPYHLTRFLYRWIRKPDVNIFLHAPAETILARKQELSEEAIEQLTSRYKILFNELQEKYPVHHYESLENTDLNNTLQTIEQTLTQKL